MKSFSTKSSVFNWSVVKSQPSASDVLRLRGGTGSPSPSPPPTRPTSPSPEGAALTSERAPEAAASSGETVRPVRPALAIRSRSSLRRSQDLSLSPVRRHTAPVRAREVPRSRKETFAASNSETFPESEQVATLVDKSKVSCLNCGKDFTSERGRNDHENYYCPKKSQVPIIFIVEGHIIILFTYY